MGLFSWLFGGKKKTTAINAGYGASQQRNDELYKMINSQYGQANAQDQAGRTALNAGYDDIYGRSMDPNNNPSFSGFNEFSQTGGVDGQTRADVNQNISDYRGIRDFGNNLMETGGWTEGDKSNYRGRVASQTPSFFAGIKNNLERQNVASGGYSPGYSGSMSKLARDSAYTSQASVRDAELGLSDSVRSGKISGAGIAQGAVTGAQNARMSLAQLIASGKLAGLSGMNGVYQGGMSNALSALGGKTNVFNSSGQGNQLLQMLLAANGQGTDIQGREIKNEQDYNATQGGHWAQIAQLLLGAVPGLNSLGGKGASGTYQSSPWNRG